MYNMGADVISSEGVCFWSVVKAQSNRIVGKAPSIRKDTSSASHVSSDGGQLVGGVLLCQKELS